MASAIRNLTGVGGDVRKIARLLQKKAPPGHMLAYINQEEADLLKSRGGSGKPHEDTGVPSFELENRFYTGAYLDEFPVTQDSSSTSVAPLDLTATQGPSYVTLGEQKNIANLADQYAQYRTAPPQISASDAYGRATTAQPAAPAVEPQNQYATDFRTIGAAGQQGSGYTFAPPLIYDYDTPTAVGALPASLGVTIPPYTGGAGIAPAEPDKDLLGQVKDWWSTLQPDTKARLGIGGVGAVLGAYQAQQAAEQGRQAKEEMQRMAAPYQEQGKRLIAQAQRGELSPAAQQQLQAVQAQAAQGAQARGGVGAQQAQAQVEAFRQQLLQNQYDYGLKVAGIGDQVMMGAIKTGLQADQYVNQLTSNYFNNIVRTLYGQPPEVAKNPATTGAA